MLIETSVSRRMLSRRRSLMPSKNVDYKGNKCSTASVADELNLLSYLVRKYPKEAMNHLSAEDMCAEIDARKGFADVWIANEAMRRGIISISEE
jgi:hypothetical protein